LRLERAQQLLPLVEDEEWFFDTELLVTAERLGWRIGEVPVDWVDDPDSRVNVVSTAIDDLCGVRRLLFRRPKGLQSSEPRDVAADQLLRFAGVGVISTLGYLFLFIAWRPMVGALGANAVAMAIATLFNTAVHRELSHGSDGLVRRGRMILVALSLYAISLALTTGALLTAGAVTSGSLVVELIFLTVANAAAAIFRFSVLRAWVFRPRALSNPAPILEVS
jgi:putative flippase GtrA